MLLLLRTIQNARDTMFLAREAATRLVLASEVLAALLTPCQCITSTGACRTYEDLGRAYPPRALAHRIS